MEREEYYLGVKQKFKEMLQAASLKTVMEEIVATIERLVVLEIFLKEKGMSPSEDYYRAFLTEHWEEVQEGTHDWMNWIIGRVYGKEG